MTEMPFRDMDDAEFGYGHLAQIVLRRLPWFIGAMLVALVIAAIATLREKPIYESSMQLLVEPNYRQRFDITGEQEEQTSLSEMDYATQLNLMRSKQFIKQAVGLVSADYPTACYPNEEPDNCVKRFQNSLTLSQLAEDKIDTRIFKAVFTSEDPALAEAFLDALKTVYLNYNLEQQEQRLNRGLATVNQQLDEVKQNLIGSQQDLEQFREQQNLINPEEQAKALTDMLTQVETAQQEAQANYQDTLARYTALQQRLNVNPNLVLVASRLSQSTRYQNLLNEIQKTELALEQRRALYTGSDPGVQDLASQMAQQMDLLKAEVRRVVGDVPASLDLSPDELRGEGQLGEIDLTLIETFVTAQVDLNSLQARLQSLKQTEQELRTSLNRFPGLIAAYDRLQPEVETQRNSLEQLLELRQQLSSELAQGGFNWQVVEEPSEAQQTSPSMKKNMLLGLIAGLFLGGVLAFGREALDRVVHTSDDLKKQTGLPLLGIVPEMPPPESAFLGVNLPILRSPSGASPSLHTVQWQPFRESVDLIYKNIQLADPTTPLTSLMVTSALAGEGKTTVALGLAMSAARAHRRVLLIDADLRRPALHERLGLTGELGLSALLANPSLTPRPISVSLAGSSLDVVTAGLPPNDPIQLLNSRRMADLLSQFESSYDLVIIDTPVLLGLVDALQVASLCDGVVVVSRLDQVTQADLNQTTAALSKVNTLGIVANGYRGPVKTYYAIAGDRNHRLIPQ